MANLPSSPESGIASSGSAGRPDPLAAAWRLVAELAKSLETQQASEALMHGNRRAAEEVLSIADRLRALVQHDSDKGDPVVGVDRPREGPAKKERGVIAAGKLSRPSGRGSAGAARNRTEFHRSGNQLVKHGMAGTSKAYRHLAPLALVNRVTTVAEGLMRNAGEFGFDDVAAALPNDRGYQIRVVMAWMRSVELLEVRLKGRYVASPGLPSRAAEEVVKLREEERAGFRSSERVRSSAKSNARGKGAGKTSSRRKRLRSLTD